MARLDWETLVKGILEMGKAWLEDQGAKGGEPPEPTPGTGGTGAPIAPEESESDDT